MSSAGGASPGCSGATGANSYKFYAGALAPGTYHVVVVTSSAYTGDVATAAITGTALRLPAWVVNATPTLTFTSPSEEGSDDDFATTSAQ